MMGTLAGLSSKVSCCRWTLETGQVPGSQVLGLRHSGWLTQPQELVLAVVLQVLVAVAVVVVVVVVVR